MVQLKYSVNKIYKLKLIILIRSDLSFIHILQYENKYDDI